MQSLKKIRAWAQMQVPLYEQDKFHAKFGMKSFITLGPGLLFSYSVSSLVLRS